MSNRIFETILNRKIENFVSTFVEDSKSIFFNGSQLIHPAEYGKYRENSTKDLIQLLTKYKVSDGFILTSNDEVSSQCDIVIYDQSEIPILENNFTQFFTIESVISIGEVKSSLTITKFKEALLKLAKNKMLFQSIAGVVKKKGRSTQYNASISFLVCKDLDFDPTNLDLEKIYGDIPRDYWHNFILIVDQGLITYKFFFNDFIEPFRSLFVSKKGDLGSNAYSESSTITFHKHIYNCEYHFIPLDDSQKFLHISLFLAGLSQALSYKALYKTELLRYSGLPKVKIFKETEE